jgi:hypothetical protein
MRVSRIVIGFGVFFLAAGLAFGRKVRIDYDHSCNFYKYQTFTWIQEPEPKNPFMKPRIINAVNAQLMRKGLEPAREADIAITAETSYKEVQTLNTYYSGGGGWGWGGWGWGGWGGGGGWATTTVETHIEGTLVVQLLDAKTQQPIWQGTSTHRVSSKPEKAAEKLQKEIRKMFEEFPPGWNESRNRS